MYRFLAVLQSFLACFLTEYSARHCVHVDLKDALFPYYWCRQSLTYFSAPPGEYLGLLKGFKIGLFLRLLQAFVGVLQNKFIRALFLMKPPQTTYQ